MLKFSQKSTPRGTSSSGGATPTIVAGSCGPFAIRIDFPTIEGSLPKRSRQRWVDSTATGAALAAYSVCVNARPSFIGSRNTSKNPSVTPYAVVDTGVPSSRRTVESKRALPAACSIDTLGSFKRASSTPESRPVVKRPSVAGV